MGCAMGVVKYLIFIFNLIFALSGLAILVMGVLIYREINSYNQVGDFLGDKFSSPPIVLIAVGSVVFIVAFFGCCGAVRESHCMIITFAVLLLTIFIAEVTVGIIAFLHRNDIESVGQEAMVKSFEKYNVDGDVRRTFDVLQHDLKCCGVEGPQDYLLTFKNSSLPSSCCVKDGGKGTMCTFSTSSTLVHTRGCYPALKEYINTSGLILGTIAVGVAFIELIGIIFAFCLANSIKNESRRMGMAV